MGFVVMACEESVLAACSTAVHLIKGWPIEVRSFIRPADRPEDDLYFNEDDGYDV